MMMMMTTTTMPNDPIELVKGEDQYWVTIDSFIFYSIYQELCTPKGHMTQ